MEKNIVFDMDGVLIDTEALSMKFWKKIAVEHNIKDIENTLIQCIGITAPETEAVFARTYGADFPYQEYRAVVSSLFRECVLNNELPVKKGVYELFDFLKQNHYHIGLASSTRKAVVEMQMAQIGLLDYFDVVVCGDMVQNSKPHPEIYEKACQQLKAEPSLCFAVEDSFNGIRSAYCAGMKPIMVPDLLQPDEEIAALLYKKCDSLLAVQEFLSSCCS